MPPLQALGYSFSNVVPAFRQFSRAQHVGKVVTYMPFPAGPGGREEDGADGAWIISGGLGAIGVLVADWLAGHGRTHILLLGRTGRYVPAAALQQLGSACRAFKPLSSRRSYGEYNLWRRNKLPRM